ncbi:MAG: hypothetical protein P8Y61_04490 [Gammaproteobacteria bacterium]
MKRLVSLWVAFTALMLFAACTQPSGGGDGQSAADTEYGPEIVMVDGVKTKRVEGFGGVIAERYDDSKEWWPDYEEPNEDAPKSKRRTSISSRPTACDSIIFTRPRFAPRHVHH